MQLWYLFPRAGRFLNPAFFLGILYMEIIYIVDQQFYFVLSWPIGNVLYLQYLLTYLLRIFHTQNMKEMSFWSMCAKEIVLPVVIIN